MMWIFEWDILTGDSAVLDVIYSISRDHLDEAIDGGAVANAAVARMQALVGATDPSTWKDPSLRSMFTKTLDYEASTLRMLGGLSRDGPPQGAVERHRRSHRLRRVADGAHGIPRQLVSPRVAIRRRPVLPGVQPDRGAPRPRPRGPRPPDGVGVRRSAGAGGAVAGSTAPSREASGRCKGGSRRGSPAGPAPVPPVHS